jgi:cytochrome subunit of sulfide dehydrogenase
VSATPRPASPRLAARLALLPLGTLALVNVVGAAAAAEPPAGATSCSGCHTVSATVETPVPPIRGRDAIEIVSAMQGFRSGERPSTVMGRIAKGFTDDEIRAIAAWLATQH